MGDRYPSRYQFGMVSYAVEIILKPVPQRMREQQVYLSRIRSFKSTVCIRLSPSTGRCTFLSGTKAPP